jgi:hypothetical protein
MVPRPDAGKPEPARQLARHIHGDAGRRVAVDVGLLQEEDVRLEAWEKQVLSARGLKRVAYRKALRTRHTNGMEVRKKRPGGFKKRPGGFK